MGPPARRPPRGAPRPRRAWTLALLAGPFLAARDPRAAEEPRSEVLMGAAASLAEPLAAIAADYQAAHPGVRVRLVLGASSALAAQLRAGAPLELLVAADPRLLDGLGAEGLVAEGGRLRLAGNRLVVLVRAGLAGSVAFAPDLTRPELRRIAVPGGAVPLGRYARAWLAARGLLRALEPRLVATEHARASLAAVDAGDVDAAIAYATDARLAASARVAFEVPAADQPEIVYEAAVRTGAGPEARDLFAFLAGDHARRALAAAGFAPPPGGP